MTTQLSKLLVLASLALCVPVGCGDKAGDTKEAKIEVLDKAPNGSPITVKFLEFTEDEGKGMKVRLYNTGDKPAVAYSFLFRYYDASDKVLEVKPGTPFASDTDFTSMSGNKYKCEPKQNATLDIDGRIITVPEGAVRAEILATQVRTLGADGNSIEDWFSQDDFRAWPAG